MDFLEIWTNTSRTNSVTFCGLLLVLAGIVDFVLATLRKLILKNCVADEIEAYYRDQEMKDRDLLDWIAENMKPEELIEILEIDMYDLVEALTDHILQSDYLPIIEMKRRGLLE